MKMANLADNVHSTILRRKVVAKDAENGLLRLCMDAPLAPAVEKDLPDLGLCRLLGLKKQTPIPCLLTPESS